MLLFYTFTLQHSTSPESLRTIANLDHLIWQTELAAPINYLVTYPFRWLPGAWIPLAINFFTVICAALALALLARCAAILPHDRTRLERQRNSNHLAFLTIPSAWVPPVLAVLMCGLQAAFWHHSVAATGEMVDLLLFAYLVRCLLEFRLSEDESWLLKFTFVAGLAAAEDWAMVAYLPAFLLAIFWMKGLFNFFNPVHFARFLKGKQIEFRLPLRMAVLWLAGCMTILLLPLIASCSRRNHVNFWPMLKFVLHQYDLLLRSRALPARIILYLVLTTIVPVAFMGIRWSRVTRQTTTSAPIVTWLFHFIHAVFLLLALWVAADAPFSPTRVQPIYACLPLYFLNALSVGYYAGYFLLVFGMRRHRDNRRDRSFNRMLNVTSIAAVWALVFLAPAIMLGRNLPDILRQRHDAVSDYLDLAESTLPPPGSAILSEDPDRLNGLATRLIRSGKKSDYLLVDATLITRFPNYLKSVSDENPQFKIAQTLAVPFASATNPAVVVSWLRHFSRSGGVYFMHPCAGFLTENFFPQTEGIFNQLRPYPTNALFPPPLTREIYTTNTDFWRAFREERLPRLLALMQPRPAPDKNFQQRLLALMRRAPQPDRPTQIAGFYYSMMLNSWGVDLQRAGVLSEAGQCFDEARKLNPENSAAQMNLQCNEDLRAHKTLTINPAAHVVDKLGRGREWDAALLQDGPIDEPNACYQLGLVCLDSRMYRQAIQQFGRAARLAPTSPDASLRLAELFLRIGDTSNSLAQAQRTLTNSPENSRALFVKGLDLIELKKYDEAILPLNTLIHLKTNDVDAHLARGLAFLKMDKLNAAHEDYTAVIHEQPTAFPAYYGLADIAQRRKDIPELIKNCELYLTNVPPNAPETDQIGQWLKEYKSGANTPSAGGDRK
jgi:tetratricopeptide (TPR) repeat protein